MEILNQAKADAGKKTPKAKARRRTPVANATLVSKGATPSVQTVINNRSPPAAKTSDAQTGRADNPVTVPDDEMEAEAKEDDLNGKTTKKRKVVPPEKAYSLD